MFISHILCQHKIPPLELRWSTARLKALTYRKILRVGMPRTQSLTRPVTSCKGLISFVYLSNPTGRWVIFPYLQLQLLSCLEMKKFASFAGIGTYRLEIWVSALEILCWSCLTFFEMHIICHLFKNALCFLISKFNISNIKYLVSFIVLNYQ